MAKSDQAEHPRDSSHTHYEEHHHHGDHYHDHYHEHHHHEHGVKHDDGRVDEGHQDHHRGLSWRHPDDPRMNPLPERGSHVPEKLPPIHKRPLG